LTRHLPMPCAGVLYLATTGMRLLQERRVAHTAIDDSSDTSARTHRACQ
jgi:hypothetical protein